MTPCVRDATGNIYITVLSVSQWRPEALPFGLPDEVDAFCGLGYKP
jgi:hypothetical protein